MVGLPHAAPTSGSLPSQEGTHGGAAPLAACWIRGNDASGGRPPHPNLAAHEGGRDSYALPRPSAVAGFAGMTMRGDDPSRLLDSRE